jgi:hypothetical protein
LEALEQFLDEMAISFREVARILRAGHHCAIVVGESPNRVGYLERFEKILVECGLDIEDRIQRRLPRQRALSPQLETERILLCRRVLKP